jgi:hypothetical protein
MNWTRTSVALLALMWSARLAADEDQVKWVRLDEARARSAATGKPVLVICLTDLIPDGPGTKGIDRSFTSELIRPLRDEFVFVKCTDMATIRAVKATSKCELITLDPDGDEILRTVVKSTQEIAAAMKNTLARYANQPIHWSADPPAPVERSPDSKRLTVLLFGDASDDVAFLIRSLEDRVVAKLHPRCSFVAMPYRKDSADVAKWNVLAAPTLILLDAEKEFGPKAVVERMAEKRTPRELKTLLRRALVAVERTHR